LLRSAPAAVRSLLLRHTARPPRATLFPYTTLFRSSAEGPSTPPRWSSASRPSRPGMDRQAGASWSVPPPARSPTGWHPKSDNGRSEEHTSELQSRENLVCRLLLEKKKEATSSNFDH